MTLKQHKIWWWRLFLAIVISTVWGLSHSYAAVVDIGGVSLAVDTPIINDAGISEFFPTTNDGTDASFFVGQDGAPDAIWGLFKFANIPDSVPVGEQCDSAWLGIKVTATSGNDQTGVWAPQINRLLRDWIEHQATWNIYSTGNSWTEPGAGSEGNDISSTVIGDSVKVNNGAWAISIDTSDFLHTLPDTIWFKIDESYIDSVDDGTIATDFGFRLTVDTTSSTFRGVVRSSLEATVGQHPVLRLFTSAAPVVTGIDRIPGIREE